MLSVLEKLVSLEAGKLAPFYDLDMKYIDADRLKAEIEKTYKSEIQPWLSGVSATSAIYDYVLPIIDSLQQEQPEVDYNEFEKLFDDFCERNKGHHITSHDACMWFWELGLNARKKD